ncbi:MAG: hypothetical protein EON59_02925 [Alphaproteobacteria bacterium]|nr:MAG: hypothetical protein EON59_02925 [Alphaproteobacteria bacterium]
MARLKTKRLRLHGDKPSPAPIWKPQTTEPQQNNGAEEESDNNPNGLTDQPTSSSSDDTSEPTDFLRRYSLRGFSKRLAESATRTTPLFDNVALSGQATIFYAEPNAGKTLMAMWFSLKAISEGRADPDLLYYVNADDSSEGLAEKAALTDEAGAHMIAAHHRGFKATNLFSDLSKMTEAGDAKGRVVIIDTVKKVGDIMSKAAMREIGEFSRAFVSAGGTVVALAHTAKSRNPDGSIRYQGTTDLLEDFDAAYVAEPLSGAPGTKERIIKFTQIKARGNNAPVAAYAYSIDPDISYSDKVGSVRTVYPEELDGHAFEAGLIDDDDVIQAIRGYLVCGHGHVGKDQMIRAVSRGDNVPRSQVDRVLTKYTGEDPSRHKWFWRKAGPRKQEYYLLDLPYPPPLPGD